MKVIIIIIVALPVFAKSQSIKPLVINSAGQSFKGTTASLTYSVGEFSCKNFTSAGPSVKSGFIQPIFTARALTQNAFNVVSDLKKETSITMNPNPTMSTTVINMANTTGRVSIYITEMSGKKVLQTTTSDIKLNINVSQYPSGTYLVIIKDAKETRTLKLVKE